MRAEWPPLRFKKRMDSSRGGPSTTMARRHFGVVTSRRASAAHSFEFCLSVNSCAIICHLFCFRFPHPSSDGCSRGPSDASVPFLARYSASGLAAEKTQTPHRHPFRRKSQTNIYISTITQKLAGLAIRGASQPMHAGNVTAVLLLRKLEEETPTCLDACLCPSRGRSSLVLLLLLRAVALCTLPPSLPAGACQREEQPSLRIPRVFLLRFRVVDRQSRSGQVQTPVAGRKHV
jgi:hypothetical protein